MLINETTQNTYAYNNYVLSEINKSKPINKHLLSNSEIMKVFRYIGLEKDEVESINFDNPLDIKYLMQQIRGAIAEMQEEFAESLMILKNNPKLTPIIKNCLAENLDNVFKIEDSQKLLSVIEETHSVATKIHEATNLLKYLKDFELNKEIYDSNLIKLTNNTIADLLQKINLIELNQLPSVDPISNLVKNTINKLDQLLESFSQDMIVEEDYNKQLKYENEFLPKFNEITNNFYDKLNNEYNTNKEQTIYIISKFKPIVDELIDFVENKVQTIVEKNLSEQTIQAIIEISDRKVKQYQIDINNAKFYFGSQDLARTKNVILNLQHLAKVEIINSKEDKKQILDKFYAGEFNSIYKSLKLPKDSNQKINNQQFSNFNKENVDYKLQQELNISEKVLVDLLHLKVKAETNSRHMRGDKQKIEILSNKLSESLNKVSFLINYQKTIDFDHSQNTHAQETNKHFNKVAHIQTETLSQSTQPKHHEESNIEIVDFKETQEEINNEVKTKNNNDLFDSVLAGQKIEDKLLKMRKKTEVLLQQEFNFEL